jgi:hypothetical protein
MAEREQEAADKLAEAEFVTRWTPEEHQRAIAAIQQSESMPSNAFPSFQERVWWRAAQERVQQAEQARDEAQRELEAWRKWAQFVYLGGGPVTLSDQELRAAVSSAHDTDVAALTQALKDTKALLARAKPRHYPGECGHCGMDELPPDSCPLLKFIAEIDAALTGAQA